MSTQWSEDTDLWQQSKGLLPVQYYQLRTSAGYVQC